nr:hypothetical protein [Sphingomonas sp. CDS-1]
MDPAAYDDPEVSPSTLKLSHLIWRPWYAKAWWAGAVGFWFVVAVVPGAARVMDGGFALSLFLHPFALMWYLAGRYLWAWRKGLAISSAPSGIAGGASVANVDDVHCEEFGFFRNGVMSYLDDPTDVESPLNPANPMNPLHPMNRY